MTPQRLYDLNHYKAHDLTPEEMAEGWHWCQDWDFMLVGPGMPLEQECCCCFKDNEHA